jgi:hypothetical protein
VFSRRRLARLAALPHASFSLRFPHAFTGHAGYAQKLWTTLLKSLCKRCAALAKQGFLRIAQQNGKKFKSFQINGLRTLSLL